MSDVLARLAAIGKPKVEAVVIDGETFHVRGMSSHARAVFLLATTQAITENASVPDHTVVALGLCNPDGSPAGTTEEVHTALDPLDGAILNQLAKKIMELSGFGKKAVETAEKNPKPAGAKVPVPAGAGSRKDRRAAASRAGRVRRRN
jgi:hypothetical protein